MAIRGEVSAEEEGEGSGEAGSAAAAAPPPQNIVYVIHPNCAIEEF